MQIRLLAAAGIVAGLAALTSTTPSKHGTQGPGTSEGPAVSSVRADPDPYHGKGFADSVGAAGEQPGSPEPGSHIAETIGSGDSQEGALAPADDEALAPPPAVEPIGEAEQPPASSARIDASISFESGVRPILEAHCRPCHFEGGTLYAKMPFDRPRTIRRLGERLFTRIQKEDERAVIRTFLTQPAGPSEDPDSAEPAHEPVHPTGTH